MDKFLIFFIFLIGTAFSIKNQESYVGCTLAFYKSDTIEVYKEFIIEAKKKGCEILAFPEVAISPKPESSEYINEFSIPCDDEKLGYSPILRNISCQARNSSIYTVVSMVEKEDCYEPEKCNWESYYIYNSVAVLNRQGRIIAKYRKTHPLIDYFSPGKGEPVLFSTDFGVDFGIFVCFDILFANPSIEYIEKLKITNFIYPQAWIDSSVINGLQVQQSWSWYYHVNILASSQLKLGAHGGGIFSNGHPLAVSEWEYPRTRHQLLKANIPILQPSVVQDLPNITIPFKNELEQVYFNTKDYTNTPGNFKVSVSSHSCSVNFQAEQDGNEDQVFSLFAWRIGDETLKLLDDLCGVIVCERFGDTIGNCTKIEDVETKFKRFELTMKIKDDVRTVLPLLATKNHQTFEEENDNRQLEYVNEYETQKIFSTEHLKQSILYAILYGVVNNS